MNVIDFFKELRSTKIGKKPWFSDTKFRKVVQFGRWKIRAEMRSKNGWMGRFGGGWNYKLGIDVGGRTVLINLFIMTIAVSRLEKEDVKND